jgi:hypothetical protein
MGSKTSLRNNDNYTDNRLSTAPTAFEPLFTRKPDCEFDV